MVIESLKSRNDDYKNDVLCFVFINIGIRIVINLLIVPKSKF